YMYRNHTHRVENRIVSLSQPEIRPIMRGKSKSPVEFGPKIDVSIMDGVIDIERFSFNAFNESGDLGSTLDHYYDVHGEYPDEVLLDTLYRTRENIGMCANLGIRVSGPRLGRKPKHVDPAQRHQDQDAENRRGEIERRFSFVKGNLGLDLVKEKTAETIAVAVDTGVVMANLENLLAVLSRPISITAKKNKTAVKIDY
ncbi:putative transposase, partial [Lacticaseibacillus paracasei subsp. paracasei Lpp219]